MLNLPMPIQFDPYSQSNQIWYGITWGGAYFYGLSHVPIPRGMAPESTYVLGLPTYIQIFGIS